MDGRWREGWEGDGGREGAREGWEGDGKGRERGMTGGRDGLIEGGIVEGMEGARVGEEDGGRVDGWRNGGRKRGISLGISRVLPATWLRLSNER